MASEKILAEKKQVVSEIVDKIKNSESVILFQYQGLTVDELTKLRSSLKEDKADVKVYKNTLLKLALDELKIDMSDFLEGPNAILFGEELLEPIKVISKFAKDHDKLNIRVGIISGDVADIDQIKAYAAIPSREGLLTMLAGGMIQYIKDLSIAINLLAEQKEGDAPKEEAKPEVKEEPKEEAPAEEAKEEVAEATAEETPAEEVVEEATEEQPTEEKTEEVTENA